ncbi:MAG: hypothetical protein ACE5G6_05000 [Terriglobia bacterium]
MSRRQLLIHLCIDIEPAKKRFGGSGFDTRETSYWGFREVLFPFVAAFRERFQADLGRPLRFNWFVRADPQIGEIYGQPTWALETFRAELEQLAAAGDEIGLHMHSWRWDNRRQAWYEEVKDSAWLEGCLATGLEAFHQARGSTPFAYHAGFEYLNNLLVRLLEQAGVKLAVAPMPGLRSRGLHVEGSGRAFFFDWRRAPRHPYFPWRSDYQRPGPDAANVLMVPNTIVRQSWKSVLFHLSPFRNPQRLPRRWRTEEVYAFPDRTQPAQGSWKLGRTQIYRPKLERSYYPVPPFVEPFLVRKGLETALAHCPGWQRIPMTTAFRSDELLIEDARRNFESNLPLLVQEAERRGLDVRFVTSRELYYALAEELATPAAL